MKRLDRLVVQEMAGPWAFGVAMFSVLIMAGQFLFELTRYLAAGVPPMTVLQLTVVLLPGIMVKTFPMAVLLSSLLSFGRLSSDSEIVAIKAAGVSVARIMVPVAVFGVLVSLMTFAVNEELVPRATQVAVDIKNKIQNQLNGQEAQDVSQFIYKDGRLTVSFSAKDFSFSDRTLKGVVITVYDKKELPTVYIYANELFFNNDKDWELRGGGSLVEATPSSEQGSGPSYVTFDHALPDNIPRLETTPEELLAKTLRDLDALPMEETMRQIQKLKIAPVQTPETKDQIANLEFGYWNKVTIPLAALVFGLLGAPLGIRSHRVPASAGFWVAVIIIFGYMLLGNVLSIAAREGRMSAVVASFAPVTIGLVVAAVLIRKRD